MLGAFGRSKRAPLRAGRRPRHLRRRRRHRRGEGGADARWSTSCATPRSTGGSAARIPHGVLLSGPPGTGKTLLARAVAGEADAPFFSMSASEFVEAIVGVGASRVRDLFTKAKEAAPAIIFIDELDAIGRSRTSGIAGFSGGNDEREQTLNQILTEMDGFDSSTERDRDRARPTGPTCSTRRCCGPGRFDRRVAVQPPDRNGREAILEVHTRGVPLARRRRPRPDRRRRRPGMVGADLANLVNEAALLAARREPRAGRGGRLHRRAREDRARRRAQGDDERTTTGAAPPTTRAGTRSSGCSPPGADPVRKISIIPRGLALGVTFSAPDADRFNYTEQELIAKIKVALGGRAAEEVVFGDLDDRRRVRHPAADADRAADGRPLGDERRDRAARRAPAGRRRARSSRAPPSVSARDAASSSTRRCAGSSRRRTRRSLALLRENRDKLDALAEALLEHETLDEDDAYRAAGLEAATVPV